MMRGVGTPLPWLRRRRALSRNGRGRWGLPIVQSRVPAALGPAPARAGGCVRGYSATAAAQRKQGSSRATATVATLGGLARAGPPGGAPAGGGGWGGGARARGAPKRKQASSRATATVATLGGLPCAR